MFEDSWISHRSYYNNNYIAAYSFIMNKTVPSLCIISSAIGFFICILLWKIIYEEIHKTSSKIGASVRDVLIGFTLTNTIGQIITPISSGVFLYYFDDLMPNTSTFNNIHAEVLGMLYIWIRLANTCLIFMMLLRSFVDRHFALWSHVIVYSIVGPFVLGFYAFLTGVTGFQFSQLPLGSCSIVMCPNLPSFPKCLLWTYLIEVLDVILFVFNCIRILQLQLEKRKENKSFRFLLSRPPVILNEKYLLVYVSSVMMIAKSLEVIRIISVSTMFAQMTSNAALDLGKFNFGLLIVQSLFECAQPVLTFICVKAYINEHDRFLHFIRIILDKYKT